MTSGSVISTRCSGLLLHVSSLPSRFGIGDLGLEAREFIGRIADAGQRYWQMLPVGPTGYGNSPYSAASSFAGNPLFISPDLLSRAGLVGAREVAEATAPRSERVDFDQVGKQKQRFLAQVESEFTGRCNKATRIRFEDFKDRNGRMWLDDYCLYAALKEAHGQRAWIEWGADLAKREPTALSSARNDLTDATHRKEVEQFLFFDQWRSLKDEAGRRGVRLVGDLPLYVAHDSADVWANQDLFELDRDGLPIVVGGVPPDYFSATGQRWGNPIYDWDEMDRRDFSWWRRRVEHSLAIFDVLRIDHFRGLAGYWAIPADEPTAVNGEWRPAPGESLLRAIEMEMGGLPIVAEDLGVITEDVVALRDQFGLPGMRVAQFGYDNAPDTALHHPSNYPENVWAYTGTHDNDTTKGWFWDGNAKHQVWRLPGPRRRLYRTTQGRIPWGLIEMVAASSADTCVFPVQDVLGLGSSARMNTPGTAEGNWEWRLGEGQLSDDVLGDLLDLTGASGRSGGSNSVS